MSAVTNEMILEAVRLLQGDLSEMKFDLREIKNRMSAAEEGQGGINRRLDRIDHRIERIEGRLNLTGLSEPAGNYESAP